MFKWLTNLVDSNEKELKRIQPLVDRVNELEPDFQSLTEAELRAKTDELKQRLADGELLDDLLPEAFAAVREAAKRTIKQRHFDVQLIGGVALHQGKISEMRTGEGKTLVATLPLYLNALTGKGCHLVTVNDYLAKRDPHWMGPIFNALGVSVSSIQHESSFLFDPAYTTEDGKWNGLRAISRQDAYKADITYGTNNEFGFDYLRDNMVIDISQCVQRGLNYAIVDEVDNILIDEARTPLIISGAAEESTKKYQMFARLMPKLKRETDFVVDEKVRAVNLTEEGTGRVEDLLHEEGLLKSPNLYDPVNYGLTHYLENALKAYVLYKKDRDYIVKEGQVIIVDEFTGRLMFGRRYSEGLHQAIEAKEGVKVQRESLTLATVTFQNYFRMYSKLAGMTGTASTEAEEFHKIYKLEVVIVPTNRATIRTDHADQIYKNEEGKFRAVVADIEKLYASERPVLIGTTSIEKSEMLSEQLKRKGVPHQVLNAKYHEREAGIIAQAGSPRSVTVATSMAGRGVDIILGGQVPDDGSPEKTAEWKQAHDKVVALGGLHIVGTERQEARRVDNQLRGRAGRQGDPGTTRFYVSLEDDIVKRFGGERIKGIMEWAGLEDDQPIEHGLVSKAIENAQVKVEGYHFDMRKHLVDYDDVVNKHREVIYGERRKIISGADLKSNIIDQINDGISAMVAGYLQDEHGINWNIEGLFSEFKEVCGLPPEFTVEAFSSLKRREIEDRLIEYAGNVYDAKEQKTGAENMRMLERLVMLRCIDSNWVNHLTAMENMRQGIGLQAVAQSDPLIAYKKEGHALFESLLASIRHDVVHTIYRVSIERQEEKRTAVSEAARRQPEAVGQKVGRNDPCPCGSGKKYKKCCGR